MTSTKPAADAILSTLVILACVAMGTMHLTVALLAGGSGWGQGGAFLFAGMLTTAGLACERWRLPLLIATHWAMVFGFGLGVGAPLTAIDAASYASLFLTSAAILILANRRWKQWESHEMPEELAPSAEPAATAARERIEPRFG